MRSLNLEGTKEGESGSNPFSADNLFFGRVAFSFLFVVTFLSEPRLYTTFFTSERSFLNSNRDLFLFYSFNNESSDLIDEWSRAKCSNGFGGQ